MMRTINPEPFRKFAEFVASSRRTGHDIVGNSKAYVPFSALHAYWTPAAISRVFQAFPDRLDISVPLVKRLYLRIFSTLVYTGPGAVLNLQSLFISRRITDDSFPRGLRPSEWRYEKFFRDFHEKIAPQQWQFFPLHFHPDILHDIYLDDECILPVDPLGEIARNYAAVVQRFDIHDCNDPEAPVPDDQDTPRPKTYVFKVYGTKRYESYYENELRALRRLSVRPSENVVNSTARFDSWAHVF